MATLAYRGAALSGATDLAYKSYVVGLNDNDLTEDQVNSQVDAYFSDYATVAYVQSEDAKLATEGYVDAQDALRIPLSSKGIPGGVVPLDSTGRVPPTYFGVPSSQQWNVGPWIPSAYNAAPVNATSESGLYSVVVTDPGYPYKPVVFGQVDAKTDFDTMYPVVTVRLGNAGVGTVIAQGRGAADGVPSYQMGDNFERADAPTLGPGWQVTYSGTGKNTLTVHNNEAKMAENSVILTQLNRTAVAQRVDPATRYTGTDYQMVELVIGAEGGTQVAADDYSFFRIYLRANETFTQYVAWEVKHDGARLVYNTGTGPETQIGGWYPTTKDRHVAWRGYAGGSASGVDDRQFTLYRNGVQVAQLTDGTGVTVMGASNRGWGFGLKSSGAVIALQHAPTVSTVFATDFVSAYEAVSVVPCNLHTVTATTGPTTLWVRLNPSAAAEPGVTASSYRPRLHVMAIPA